ncbi:MAG: NADH-quinone oxidoreductase subunit L [Promethearchaeota archaeon]
MLPYAAWLCWGFPVIGAILTPLFAKIHPKLRDYAAVLMGLLGAVFAFSMITDIMSGLAFTGTAWSEETFVWLNIPGLPTLEFGMLIDPLSVFMACVATGVGLLILVYSLGYMNGDTSLTRYWFFMQFFIGGMTLLVMANNLLQTFIGWEIVGLCSYALIGFWYNKPEMIHDDQLGEISEGDYNSHCGMKAFIVTRVGDVGLLISIIFIFFFTASAGTPTFNYQTLLSDFTWLSNMVSILNGGLLLTVLFLFFLGPIGKSAQFPLHIWLPEAMAGPSTVSALIHAAAMVKAGVYLVARMMPILVQAYLTVASPLLELVLQNFFLIVACIGAFTAFLAATMAIVSRELKKVLAYSTISQLGYMFLALGLFAITAHGVEGYFAANFHLATHAVFKALLFLSAGAVLHAVHSKDMFDMGGLRSKMPITFICMLFGALSLSGVPPFAGFWSKEVVFTSAWELVVHGVMIGYILFAAAAITGAMTFFYSLRMIGLTFMGEPSKHVIALESEHEVREAPPVMWIPLAILALTTLIFGFLQPFLYVFFFGQWNTIYHATATLDTIPALYIHTFIHTFTSPTFLITIGILLLGGIPGYFFYIRRSWDAKSLVGERGFLHGIYAFLYNRWYYNRALYKIFIDGTNRLSKELYKHVEVGIIDRFNYLLADASRDLSRFFRRIQTGVHSWNMILLLLSTLIMLILLLFGGGLLAPLLPIP